MLINMKTGCYLPPEFSDHEYQKVNQTFKSRPKSELGYRLLMLSLYGKRPFVLNSNKIMTKILPTPNFKVNLSSCHAANMDFSFSRNSSLSSITFGRSSSLHPVSVQSCCR